MNIGSLRWYHIFLHAASINSSTLRLHTGDGAQLPKGKSLHAASIINQRIYIQCIYSTPILHCNLKTQAVFNANAVFSPVYRGIFILFIWGFLGIVIYCDQTWYKSGRPLGFNIDPMPPLLCILCNML